MRAFVAIVLSREVRDVLAGLVGHLELARVGSLRTVNPDGIHLTLKFLGEVSEQLAPSIAGEVERAVAGHSPFTLNIGGSGVFPDERRARVLWVGLQGDLPSLLRLQADVEGALATMGFRGEKRSFRPHLTLGRMRDGASLTDRQMAAEALYSARLDSGTPIHVDSVSLMRSFLRPGEAAYLRLARMPLAEMAPE